MRSPDKNRGNLGFFFLAAARLRFFGEVPTYFSGQGGSGPRPRPTRKHGQSLECVVFKSQRLNISRRSLPCDVREELVKVLLFADRA